MACRQVLAESARRSQSDRWPIDMVALMPSKLVKADSQMCRVLRAVGCVCMQSRSIKFKIVCAGLIGVPMLLKMTDLP